MSHKRKNFSMRGFTSLLLAFCFVGLALSGIIIYFAPPCSIAERINWTILSLSKTQWASMHQVSALFILGLSVIHLFVFNWNIFLCYFKRRKSNVREGSKKRRWQKEVIAAVIVALVMYIGAIMLIAPFSLLHEGSDSIKKHYQEKYPTQRGYDLNRLDDIRTYRSDRDTDSDREKSNDVSVFSETDSIPKIDYGGSVKRKESERRGIGREARGEEPRRSGEGRRRE